MTKPFPCTSSSQRSGGTVGNVTNVLQYLICSPVVALLFAIQPAVSAENEVTAEQVVGAIEAVFGATPGERRNHTKGTCAAGEFVGIPKAAKAYTRSALFSGQPVPVVARFSLAGGNPVPEKIRAFKASHPDNLAQAVFLERNNPPASYANSAYFGIHTFRFIDRADKTTPVRWRFVPQDGEKRLTDAELQTMPKDFLEQALIARTKRGPVKWDMVIALGQPGDPEDDPTVAWPEDRKQLKVGTLTLGTAMPQQGAACEQINFDPLVMSDGIAPTNDPVLLFRSPAYAVSFARRMGGM